MKFEGNPFSSLGGDREQDPDIRTSVQTRPCYTYSRVPAALYYKILVFGGLDVCPDLVPYLLLNY